MPTMNISLTESMIEYVDHQLNAQAYTTYSQYVRHLIAQDQKAKAFQHLSGLFHQGLESGAIPYGADFWNMIHDRMAEDA